MRAVRLALAGLVLASSLIASGAQAEVITFKVRSFSQYAVGIAFFSQNRNHAWPSFTTVNVIKNYDVQSYPLTCVAGEKICYGASVRGNASTYWGVGTDGKQRCTNCCWTCGDTQVTPVINLNER